MKKLKLGLELELKMGKLESGTDKMRTVENWKLKTRLETGTENWKLENEMKNETELPQRL